LETHDFLLQFMAILVAAQVLGTLANRIGIPTVIGEICAGIVLGPSLLGLVAPTEVFQMLAEFGIVLLLFEVGLETDMDRLIRAGGRSGFVAIAGFIAPFVLAYLLAAHLFHLPRLVALFIGGTLTATSIGITVRVLADLRRQSSAEAQIVLGAAVIDDILGVVLLAALYEFSVAGKVELINTGKIILFIGAFLLLAPLVAKLFTDLIRSMRSMCEVPNAIPVLLTSLILLFSWVAHVIGAPELLGGFAAGLALSRRFFLPFGIALHSQECFGPAITERMRPIIGLFTPVFFVMVGLSLDLGAVNWGSQFIWVFSLALFLVAVAGKLLGPLLLHGDPGSRWAVGLAMVPRGEVGLVFAELGRSTRVFDQEVYAGMVLVIALTTLLAPFALKGFYQRFAPS
jgi:Kef-type K+ transport system membrane component KefB